MKNTNLLKILQGGAVAACVALLLGWAALPGYSQFSCIPSSVTSVWNATGTSNWDDGGSWNPSGVPNAKNITVCITNGTAASPTTVELLSGDTNSVGNVAINTNNTLSMAGGSSLGVFGSTLGNAGTILIGGELDLDGPMGFAQLLQGGGTVNLANGSIVAKSSAMINVDNTIQGLGTIHVDNAKFVNEAGGTVEAGPSEGLVVTQLNGGVVNLSLSITNDGTFEADGGGILVVDGELGNYSNGTLTGGTWDAAGGILLAFTGVPGASGGAITTNDANIILDNSLGTAGISDMNGHNALETLANNEGTLTLENGADMSLSTLANNEGTLTLNNGSAMSLSMNLTNSGTINVGSNSTLTLTAGYTQTGLGSANVTGTLDLEGGLVQLGFGSVTAGPQGEVEYSNGAAVVGGFLMGSGEHFVGGGGASFVATTIDSGPTFLVGGPTSFTNVTNNGAITVQGGQTLNWNGGSNADSGSLTVGAGATANVTSFTSSGVMTITGSGAVANSGTNLTLGGGSRTYVGSKGAPSGTLSTVAGTTIELNGGLLDNNGKVSGTLDVNYGSLAEGAGTYGVVNVNNGGAFHPGNSPGIATSSSATWGAGGAYQFSINSATGTAGTNWSLWNVTGNLNITAGTTPNSQFVIEIDSLLANDSAGALTDFNPTDPYTWLIANAGSITGFNAADFAFDTSGFANALDGGTFSLADGSTGINLMFTPKSPTITPEPSTLSLLVIGVLGLAIYLRRGNLLGV